MIFMASTAIIGPFGNYFVPIMIGARNMAFRASKRSRSGSSRLPA